MTIISDITGIEFLNSAFIFVIILLITQWTISIFAKRTRKSSAIEQSRDSDLQNIELLTFEIRSMCLKYWTKEFDSADQFVMGQSIIARFDFLEVLILRLFKNDQNKLRALLNLYKLYKDYCTGHDFLSNDRKLRPLLVKNIEKYAYSVADLSLEFRRKLPFENT